MKKIQIKTPSRLHLGFLNFGNKYGSVGVAIQEPNFVIETKLSDKLKVEGTEKKRALQYAKLFIKKLDLKKNVKIKILKIIPEHVGLGSGTQLALGIGCSIAKLFELDVSVNDLAALSNRGKVSRIGIHAFESGSFIVDTEKEKFHCPLPENWLWVVAIPKNEKGFSGRKEENAFKSLPKFSEEKIKELQEIKRKIIKSVIEKDIISFGKAMTELDKKNGELFSKSQKGLFFNPEVEDGVKFLLKNKAYGAGQSSWGPSFYGLFDNNKESIPKIKEKLEKNFNCSVIITKTQNSGAEIKKVL